MSSKRAVAALPAVLLFLLFVFSAPPAFSADSSPLSGDSQPTWGIGVRGGVYGVPDWILDLLFEQHPGVDGTMVGAELRYFGRGGPKGVFSVALTFDVGSTEGTGIWQEDAGDPLVAGGGGMDLVAGTVTAYWDIKPSSALHPYIGLGLGLGYAEGFYERDDETVHVEEVVPAVHIPVGLMLNLGPNFGVAVEGRVINGLTWGGMAQLRF